MGKQQVKNGEKGEELNIITVYGHNIMVLLKINKLNIESAQ